MTSPFITSVRISANGSMNAVVGIGDQQHVAFVDRRPAADAGSVDAEAFFEAALIQLADRIGDVMLQAGNVRESQVQLFGVVLLCVFEYFLRGHPSSSNAVRNHCFTSSSISAREEIGMRWVMRSFLANPPVSISLPSAGRAPRANPRSMRVRVVGLDLREDVLAIERHHGLAGARFHVLAEPQAEFQQRVVDGAKCRPWRR